MLDNLKSLSNFLRSISSLINAGLGITGILSAAWIAFSYANKVDDTIRYGVPEIRAEIAIMRQEISEIREIVKPRK